MIIRTNLIINRTIIIINGINLKINGTILIINGTNLIINGKKTYNKRNQPCNKRNRILFPKIPPRQAVYNAQLQMKTLKETEFLPQTQIFVISLFLQPDSKQFQSLNSKLLIICLWSLSPSNSKLSIPIFRVTQGIALVFVIEKIQLQC